MLSALSEKEAALVLFSSDQGQREREELIQARDDEVTPLPTPLAARSIGASRCSPFGLVYVMRCDVRRAPERQVNPRGAHASH